jgi:hypothetical protein
MTSASPPREVCGGETLDGITASDLAGRVPAHAVGNRDQQRLVQFMARAPWTRQYHVRDPAGDGEAVFVVRAPAAFMRESIDFDQRRAVHGDILQVITVACRYRTSAPGCGASRTTPSATGILGMEMLDRGRNFCLTVL